MVTQRDINFRIEPYVHEAIIQIILDALITTLLLILFIYIGIPLIICITVVITYLGIELMFFYKIVIQALIDRRKKDYIVETLSIKTFDEELSLAGNRTGHSYISSIYPKEWHVKKYKLTVINIQGEKKKIRTVMSFRRMLQFMMLSKEKIENLQITYLKRSKILLCVYPEHQITKRTGCKKINQIEKSFHFINERI